MRDRGTDTRFVCPASTVGAAPPHPDPDLPEGTWITRGRTPGGAPTPIAHINCLCRGWWAVDGTGTLRPGQGWRCPDCWRVYEFDGVTIVVREPSDADAV